MKICADLTLEKWTAPQIDTGDEWEVNQHAAAFALSQLGAIAIPGVIWDQWRTLAPQLPDVAALSPTNGAALAGAWCLGPGRPARPDGLIPMLQARLLSCDTLDTRDALDRVHRWVDRLTASATTPVAGVLRPPEAIGARAETLYFDGPAEEDWTALAIRGSADFPLLDRDHAFVPGEA